MVVDRTGGDRSRRPDRGRRRRLRRVRKHLRSHGGESGRHGTGHPRRIRHGAGDRRGRRAIRHPRPATSRGDRPQRRCEGGDPISRPPVASPHGCRRGAVRPRPGPDHEPPRRRTGGAGTDRRHHRRRSSTTRGGSHRPRRRSGRSRCGRRAVGARRRVTSRRRSHRGLRARSHCGRRADARSRTARHEGSGAGAGPQCRQRAVGGRRARHVSGRAARRFSECRVVDDRRRAGATRPTPRGSCRDPGGGRPGDGGQRSSRQRPSCVPETSAPPPPGWAKLLLRTIRLPARSQPATPHRVRRTRRATRIVAARRTGIR